jgi:GNAT superfamily N-acetyltransferase
VKARELIDAYVGRGKRKQVELGDGFFANQSWAAEDKQTWEFFNGDQDIAQSEKVGELSLYFYPELNRWTINSIHLDDGVRGKGLGRRLLTILNRELKLGSDPQGVTSDAATRMWQALGAKKTPVDKNSKGYFYTI